MMTHVFDRLSHPRAGNDQIGKPGAMVIERGHEGK